MSRSYLAHVRVSFKPGIHDPESETISRALSRMGFDRIASLHAGKFFDIDIEASNRDEAVASAQKMCETLLANPVIETYTVEIIDGK